MKKIIFSKYSNDRNVKFKIHTDILEDESKKRYVRKVGMTEEGKSHLKGMFEKAQKLSELYQGSIFEINACKYDSDGELELEYVQGRTLEDMLDAWLTRGKQEQFQKLVMMYGDAIRKLATEVFEPCPEYYEVFGADAYVPQDAHAMAYSNVDMIFPNLIENGEKWIVLDYEWTFAMKVPVDFILYRAINYYQTPDRKQEMRGMDLYELLGVDRGLIQTFQKMEENFQKFVYAGNTPLWELYGTMGKLYFFPAGMIAARRMQEEREKVQIVRFYDNRFESEPVQVAPDERGNVSVEIACRGCNTLRVDVAHASCVVRVDRVIAVTDAGEQELAYGANGESSDGKLFYFHVDDPQLLIGDIQETYKAVRVEYNIEFVNKQMLDFLEKKNQAFNDMRCENMKHVEELNEQGKVLYEHNAQIDGLKNQNGMLIEQVKNLEEQKGMLTEQVKQLEDQIAAMENSTSWKITKPIRTIKSQMRRES